jgi:hypothetical protein
VTLLLAASAASCTDPGDAALTSVVHLGVPTTFKPGQGLEVGALTLVFDGVENDSRCPADVVCVWEGDATVHFSIGFTNREILAPVRLLELHTGGSAPHAASGYGYRVTLTGLEPLPRAGVPIKPEDYRATVEVMPDAGVVAPAAGHRP